MEPTAEGLRLLETAARVLDDIERTEFDLHSFKKGTRGLLRVAAQCYTCYRWIPRAMPAMATAFPEIDLQIVPEATGDAIGALLAERIDLAIVHRFPQHAEIAVEPLFSDEYVAILPPDHPLAGREWVEALDFAEERILLHSSAEESLLFSRYLSPAGVRPARVSQLGLSEAIFEAVRAGLGVSAMTRWMAEDQIRAGNVAFARLAPDGLERPWHAAVLRRRSDAPAIVELVRLLRSHGPAIGARTAPAVSPTAARASGSGR
jgi:LysR family transcriptional regulator for metE and metH